MAVRRLLGMALTLTWVNSYGVKVNWGVSQTSSRVLTQVNNVAKNKHCNRSWFNMALFVRRLWYCIQQTIVRSLSDKSGIIVRSLSDHCQIIVGSLSDHTVLFITKFAFMKRIHQNKTWLKCSCYWSNRSGDQQLAEIRSPTVGIVKIHWNNAESKCVDLLYEFIRDDHNSKTFTFVSIQTHP